MNKDFEKYLAKFKEVGFVRESFGAVVFAEGLPEVALDEMVYFENGGRGKVIGLARERVKILVLGSRLLDMAEKIVRSGEKVGVRVGKQLLGKVVNSLGVPINNEAGEVEGEYREVEAKPWGITLRKRINRRFTTGVMMVDLMVPLGKGQRELIIGDRKIGKSLLLLQLTLAQAREGSICIYTAVGKKRSEIMGIQKYLIEQGVNEQVIVVAASGMDSPGEIVMAPYTAMTIAEYFRDNGQDALVVIDDLSVHAKYYREIALISKKFPGRSSYPGDIFYTHSRLLERAGNFWVNDREVAITCLPVAETVAGDFSDYISTNIMSMTDGHIYYDADMYFRGRRPAINTFLSVTRVGRQTQSPLQVDANRLLTDLLSNYEKTQGFQKFGAELGENSRQILAMGERLFKFFDQPVSTVVPENLQMILLGLLISGMWSGKNIDTWVNKYIQDINLRKLVDGMVSSCDSVAKLLEAVRVNSSQFSGNI